MGAIISKKGNISTKTAATEQYEAKVTEQKGFTTIGKTAAQIREHGQPVLLDDNPFPVVSLDQKRNELAQYLETITFLGQLECGVIAEFVMFEPMDRYSEWRNGPDIGWDVRGRKRKLPFMFEHHERDDRSPYAVHWVSTEKDNGHVPVLHTFKVNTVYIYDPIMTDHNDAQSTVVGQCQKSDCNLYFKLKARGRWKEVSWGAPELKGFFGDITYSSTWEDMYWFGIDEELRNILQYQQNIYPK